MAVQVVSLGFLYGPGRGEVWRHVALDGSVWEVEAPDALEAVTSITKAVVQTPPQEQVSPQRFNDLVAILVQKNVLQIGEIEPIPTTPGGGEVVNPE